jgi:hypothetical protein
MSASPTRLGLLSNASGSLPLVGRVGEGVHGAALREFAKGRPVGACERTTRTRHPGRWPGLTSGRRVAAPEPSARRSSAGSAKRGASRSVQRASSCAMLSSA